MYMDKTYTALNGTIRVHDEGVDVNVKSRSESLRYDEISKISYTKGNMDIYTKSKGNIRLRFEEKNNNELNVALSYIGERLNKKQTPYTKPNKKMGASILCAGIVIALIIFIASMFTNSSEKLTLSKYNQIENGMTYAQVVNIIGCEGEVEVESGKEGTSLHTISYRYMGSDKVKGSLGANASFMFQGGELVMKAQLGLK